MKKIEAFIRHEAFEPIRMELLDKGFPSLSIAEYKGSGRQKGITEQYRGSELTIHLRPEAQARDRGRDKDVGVITETILKHARTGQVGDGKIFVLPVEDGDPHPHRRGRGARPPGPRDGGDPGGGLIPPTRRAGRSWGAARPVLLIDMAMTAPESLPSPRGAHLEMVGAVLAGDGLERVAEIAATHAGAPVAVIVPRLGAPVEAWAALERYVAKRLAGGKPERPREVTAEVPIVSGGQELGAVLMLGKGGADAGEYLHVAAVAALTEVAVAEARDETEQNLRGSFLEELLTRDDLDPGDVVRRAAPAGLRPLRRARSACAPTRASAPPGACWPPSRASTPARWPRPWAGACTRCCPARSTTARQVANRLGRQALGRPLVALLRGLPTCAARSRRPSWCWA